jgi:hypothetical protein
MRGRDFDGAYLSDAPVRAYQDKRRARNAAAGNCINDTVDGTHGPATHGCRCRRCYAAHKGIDIDLVPLVYVKGQRLTKPILIDAKAHAAIAAVAKRTGRTMRSIADDLIGGGSTSSSPATDPSAHP